MDKTETVSLTLSIFDLERLVMAMHSHRADSNMHDHAAAHHQCLTLRLDEKIETWEKSE